MNPPIKSTGKPKTKNLSEDSIPSFIRKTFEILEEGKYADVIRWSDDGTAILINNPTEFAQKVLPVYFKHNNLTSFIRQLNMYDFHKKRSLNTGVDHVYCHELFQRGKRHLLKEIKRKNSESTAPPSEKTLPTSETPQTRQDLAAVVHENVLLKKYNRETLGRVTLLESKIKEVSIENQTLWNQIYQLREKESLMKSVIANIMKQSGLPLSSLPPFLQNELDFTAINLKNSQDQKDNSPAFTAQTTTKMFYPSTNLTFPTAFTGAQQDITKDLRVNPVQIIQQEFPIGAIQPLYHLENFGQGKQNEQQGQPGMSENKFPGFNFELNRPIQGLENWNFGFDNIRPPLQTEPDRLNQVGFQGEGNGSTELGKRKMINPGNSKEEKESYGKKVKQNPLGISDVNSKPKITKKEEANNQNIFSLGNSVTNASAIKSEGGHKENL